MDWVAAMDIAIPPLPAAVGRAAASMRTESPSWSSWRHDGALPLLVSRRAEPTAQPLVHETSTRAVDPSHVSVCELKKLGRAIRLLNSNVACSQPDFPGLSISHVMASCMQRAVCCCAEHQLRPLDRRVRLQPCSAASARLVGKDSVPYGTRACVRTLCSACICHMCMYMSYTG